jgi:hypothetical protein
MAYYDNYLQGFIELIRVKKILLDSLLKSTDKSDQYNRICFGLTILSEIIIEKYMALPNLSCKTINNSCLKSLYT